VLRRVHTSHLRPGEIELDAAASRHARDVLRLTEGTEVEAFDDAGGVARAVIVALSPAVVLRVDAVEQPAAGAVELTVAAAVPKGDLADWMVVKLSELGVARFVPLAAARSVVLPEGKNKRQRWERLATESAKQSRRRGVMRIDELTPVRELIDSAAGATFVLSTEADAAPAIEAIGTTRGGGGVTLLIGPEGGWSQDEIEQFARAGVRGVKLTDTVLRVETAAVVAAGVVLVAAAAAKRQADSAGP
jgi:16S rRNA (uracil1498-N3)-methyltransferase